MASGLYKPYKQHCLDSSAPDLSSATIKAFMIDSADYTVDLATHDFLNDVAAGGRVGSSGTTAVTLGTKTINSPEGGVFDCADFTFTSVTGDSVEALLVFEDSGTESTSDLIAWIEFSAVTPNGGNISFTVDSGNNRLFKL